LGAGLGLAAAAVATLSGQADEGGREAKVIVADERPVLFKVRDAVVERVNPERRLVSVRIGKADPPVRLTDLPLSENVRLRVSFVFPGVANNLPFSFERLNELIGKPVSLMLRAEASGLTVDAFAAAND
jgi:hypothetical protein